MQQIKVEDASTQLSDLIDAVFAGEMVYIVRDGQMIQLVPVTQRKPRQAGRARGQVIMSDDFDAPDSDFDEYM